MGAGVGDAAGASVGAAVGAAVPVGMRVGAPTTPSPPDDPADVVGAALAPAFEPKPSYWGALLWRRLMGKTVLDAGIPIREGLHVYAHCLRGTPGGVALLVLNTSTAEPTTLQLPVASDRYTLSARELTAGSVMLNDTLLSLGAIEPGYIETMLERERSVSTYVGEGVAIPHGTLAGKDVVHHDAICVLRFPAGVDWDGERVQVCVGIAARGDGHIRLLSELAQILLDADRARELREATETGAVLRLLHPTGEDAAQ